MVAEAARQVAFFALCDSTEILGIFAQSPDREPGDVAPDVRRVSNPRTATSDTLEHRYHGSATTVSKSCLSG